MARLTVALAFAALIAVAAAQAAVKAAPAAKAPATKAPAAAPFAGRKAAGAFCRHSCYPLGKTKATASCEAIVAAKTAALNASGIPFKVDGFSCKSKATTGCDVLLLQSWPSEKVHDSYQTAEDTVPTLVAMRAALPSISKIPGVDKKGLCATIKTVIA